METITIDLVSQANACLKSNSIKGFFELFFGVSVCQSDTSKKQKDLFELETWTEGCVNMIMYLKRKSAFDEFKSRAREFDIQDEFDSHRQDKG